MICRAEAPHLSRLYEAHQKDDLQVLGINATNDPEHMVQKIAKDLQLKLPILLKGSDTAVVGYAIREFPANFWLDRDGRIVEFWTGYSARKLDEKIKKLLK